MICPNCLGCNGFGVTGGSVCELCGGTGIKPLKDYTDLEYGRAWAKQEGIAIRYEDERLGWHKARWGWEGRLANRHPFVEWVLGQFFKQFWCETESDAYTALGRAVREVHRQVPRLEGEG